MIVTEIKKRGTSGATLVEALAFTVIAILFVVSAIALYNMASNSAREHQEVRHIQALQTDIKDLFQNQDSYSGLDNELLIEAEVIPGDLQIKEATSSILHSYGDELIVEPASGGRSFVIEYQNVPREACIALMSSVASTFYKSEVWPGGGTYKTLNERDPANDDIASTTLPFTAEEASEECGSNMSYLKFYSF